MTDSSAGEPRRPWLTLKNGSYLGVCLLALALPAFWLMAQETSLETYAASRYRVLLRDELTIDYHGHRVEIGDRFLDQRLTQPFYGTEPVRIRVDGQDRSVPSRLRIDTSERGAGRYWTYLSLGELVSVEDGLREFFVVQCLPNDAPKEYPKSMSWRILFLSERGEVREEVFGFDERESPLYRTLLARTASPSGLGFHSQVVAAVPGSLYPGAYPFGCALVGLGLLLARVLAPLRDPLVDRLVGQARGRVNQKRLP